MENKLDSIVLIYIMLSIVESGVGRVTPSKIRNLMINQGMDVTDYFVRKSFGALRDSGVLVFHHNHYKLDMRSGVLLDLHLLTNELFKDSAE